VKKSDEFDLAPDAITANMRKLGNFKFLGNFWQLRAEMDMHMLAGLGKVEEMKRNE